MQPNCNTKSSEFYNRRITSYICDSIGINKHRSTAKLFYFDADAVILVYDITNFESFFELENYWYNEIKQHGPKNIIFAVVANKSDLQKNFEVDNEKGEEFAKKIRAPFFSTSAKDNKGIETLYEEIGKKIVQKYI